MAQPSLILDHSSSLAAAWAAVTASLSGEEAIQAAKAWKLAAQESEAEPELRLGVGVATVLAALEPDAATLAAGLLLPLVEAHRLDTERLAEALSPEVAALVDDATRLSVMSEYRKAVDSPRQADKLRKMLLSMAQDPRAVVIRLAERLARLRARRHVPAEQRRSLAEETLELHAPLAGRLGIGQLKWALEDRAFRDLEPAAYRRIAGGLDQRRAARDAYIRHVSAELHRALSEAGSKAEVAGRAKHIYSIWSKMRLKQLDVQQLYDLLALRVLVAEIAECYAALGLVHGLWRQVPEEFDDYIARPKPNLYRSLHTVVIGPEGRPLEVQIRTYEMHRNAEMGVAAHWRYKEGRAAQTVQGARIAWLTGLLAPGSPAVEGADLIGRFTAQAFQERIYVVTPKGRVVDLPQGATPLDFAYAVHTDIGHRCRGARVDGVMVPLAYTLRSGQMVEVLTSRNGTPSRDWLNPALGYLRSSGARARVKRWFKEQDYGQHLAQGRALIEREQRRLGVTEVNLTTLARRFARKHAEDLLASLGRGELRPAQIGQALREALPVRDEPPTLAPGAALPVPPAQGEFQVLGVSNLLTRIAGCCKPVPNDAIVGYITRAQGVTVHRRHCPSLLRLATREPQRLVEVAWGTEGGRAYRAEILIEAVDRRGLLRDVSDAVAGEEVNILAVQSASDRNAATAHMSITIEIASAEALDRLLNRIARIPEVRYARRRM